MHDTGYPRRRLTAERRRAWRLAQVTLQALLHRSPDVLGLAFVAVLATSATPAWAGDGTWRDIGNVGRDVLVVAALGVPLARGDTAGALQAGGSLGSAEIVSLGLKEAFPETRPDGSDRKSFPSGHTAISFASAATLQNRYGWKVGLPAQVLAAMVGVSRVNADKHHWYDVLAGAGIGETAGFLITSRRDERVRVMPWGDTSSAGVSVSARF